MGSQTKRPQPFLVLLVNKMLLLTETKDAHVTLDLLVGLFVAASLKKEG